MEVNKLLLIDDEEVNVRVLSMSLRADGYEVVGAYSGEEGLAVFEREAPQIVLTDIKMPGMDGLQVLREIKNAKPDVEVIIITGHGDIDAAIEALHYGASDFINKPVRDDVLAISLRRAAEKIRIRQQLQDYTHNLEEMVKKATEELHRKSNFQAKLIRSSNDGIVATDSNWKTVIFNPGAEKIFGYGRDEVVGQMDLDALYPPELAAAFKEQGRDPGAPRDLAAREVSIRSKSGQLIPVRFSGSLLREEGRLMGSVAFFQDLREIKRLERELVHSERLAAVGQTVAGMAHCIKNILHGFKGGSYLVDIGIDNNDDSKLKNGWQMIQRSIARTSDLVMDLLSYSKEREPEFEPCEPNAIAAEVCDFYAKHADDNGVDLKRAFSPRIGEVLLDPRTIHRCLMNLVSNAIDACIFDDQVDKQHCVEVRTAPEPGPFVRLEVQDNGSGMSSEVRSKLFASFFSTKGPKGTGLGLLVTRKLVEEHNGTIEVDSTLNQGTTFAIRLPFKPLEQANPIEPGGVPPNGQEKDP